MLVKFAASPLLDGLKTKFKSFAKSIAEHEGHMTGLESGLLVPTIAVGDGLTESTFNHHKGESRLKEFGKGATSGAIAGAIIGGGDMLAYGVKHFGSKVV